MLGETNIGEQRGMSSESTFREFFFLAISFHISGFSRSLLYGRRFGSNLTKIEFYAFKLILGVASGSREGNVTTKHRNKLSALLSLGNDIIAETRAVNCAMSSSHATPKATARTNPRRSWNEHENDVNYSSYFCHHLYPKFISWKGHKFIFFLANKASTLLIFLWSSPSFLSWLRKHLKLTNKKVFFFQSLLELSRKIGKNKICHQAKNWIFLVSSIRVCWPFSDTFDRKIWSDTQKKTEIDFYPSSVLLSIISQGEGKRQQ